MACAINPIHNPIQLLINLNCSIAKLNHSHQFSHALQLFDKVHSSYLLKPDHYTLASALTACANLRNTAIGNQLHALCVHSGYKAYPHVYNTLLSLYAKSNDLASVNKLIKEIAKPDVYSWTTFLSANVKLGRIDVALQMFDQMPQRNVAMWNAVITGCVENGLDEIGLDMFTRMHQCGVWFDHYTLGSLLSLCFSPVLLDFGRQVHGLVVKTGFVLRDSVINASITMYFNCGMEMDGYEVFEEAKINGCCNQITYNAMIAGLVSWGKDLEALMMFIEMKEACLGPTELTFMSIMSSCSSAVMLKLGRQVHALVIKLGFEAYTSVSNATITMYSNCRDVGAATLVFQSMEEKDLVSWNSIIAVHAQQNCTKLAINAYLQMQKFGIKPDEFTFGSLLSCSEAETCKMIQALVAKNGLVSNAQVSNALVSTYSKLGEIETACEIFVNMPSINLITWNSIITGCLLNALPIRALQLFANMLSFGFEPNLYTLVTILSACASMPALGSGKQIHGYILRAGLNSEVSLCNALLTMYAKCGNLDWSSRVFNGMTQRDLISWNAMIAAYSQHGEGIRAIECFKEMQELGVTKPDQATFTIVLSACSHAGLVDEGLHIFSSMVEDHGVEPGMDQYSCIVDLLGRAGRLNEAEMLINMMPFQPDSTIWWAMLSACVAHGNVVQGSVAAKFLLQAEPDNPTIYVLLANIYATVGQWEEAASVRQLMMKHKVMKQPGCSWIEPQNPCYQSLLEEA